MKDGNKDKYMKIKEKWIDEKLKLEGDVSRHIKKQKVINNIVNLIAGQDQPYPKYKATKFK